MTTIIGIQNIKGGVGKTMLAKLMGLAKLDEGKKVLYVDLDGNDDIACRFGFKTYQSQYDIIHYWNKECSFQDMVKVDDLTGAHIIPASKRIGTWPSHAIQLAKGKFQQFMRKTLEDFGNNYGYDYIIVDTMPDLDHMYMMAILNTFDAILVPTQDDVAVLDKTAETLEWVQSVNEMRKDPASIFIVPFNINIHHFGKYKKIDRLKDRFDGYGTVTSVIRHAPKLGGDDNDHQLEDVIDPRRSTNKSVIGAIEETKAVAHYI